MRCNHDVWSYEWKKCSRCGKYVRINPFWNTICGIIVVTLSVIIADPFADWGIQFLGLTEHNPHNITHALIGCISVGLICYIAMRILPIYDEEDQLPH